MSSDLYYLKPTVQGEPLLNHWYAWPHLLSPATAARNVTHRHLKIMDSYISAPDIHAAAVKNPRMLGGPFIDYDGQRVGEIQQLRATTVQRQRQAMELSEAIDELESLLRAEAGGYSLQPLYPKVPPPLRGCVELVYDLRNQPSFRLIEPLFFRSHHDTELQSIMLSITAGDERAFALSTPRLGDAHSYHWQVPFACEAVDRLFASQFRGQPYSVVKDILPDAPEARLAEFFTTEAPPPYQPYRGRTARWRYFGHACVLVETNDTSLLVDPVLSYTYDSNLHRYTYRDLPDVIDFVLITHNHQDHVLIETLLQIRHKVRQFVVPRSSGSLQDPSLKLLLQHAGFTNVIEVAELEEITFSGGSITALPFLGEHSDLDVRCKSAYLVRLGPRSIMFAADSCNIEPTLYERLHREIGDIDALFVGMECVGAPLTWLYGPLLTQSLDRKMDQSRRLAGSDYSQALDIVTRFNCRECYVYAMGQEPWLNYVMSLKYTESSRPIVESNKLLAECRRRGIAAERLFGEREMFL